MLLSFLVQTFQGILLQFSFRAIRNLIIRKKLAKSLQMQFALVIYCNINKNEYYNVIIFFYTMRFFVDKIFFYFDKKKEKQFLHMKI